MHKRMSRILAFLSASAILVSLQACSPGVSQENSVADAYKASDTINVMPYNRSIFSSTNF